VCARWSDLAEVLSHKFTKFTGVQRQLNERDLMYLAEKLYGQMYADYSLAPMITFQRFAKVFIVLKLFFMFIYLFLATPTR
jgi:hypothetical protein